MPFDDVPSIAVHALGGFLAGYIPGLTVLEEWPNANEVLKYPSLTITKTKPKRMPQMPVILSTTEPDMNNKIVANEHVADWDDTLQLDLWTRTKPERKRITSLIMNAFASQEDDCSGSDIPDGLSLLVPEYFGEFFRFEVDTSMSADDEGSAQRQERRQKIAVLFNCREIRKRSYYAIVSTQVNVGVDYGTEDLTDDTSNTEQN